MRSKCTSIRLKFQIIKQMIWKTNILAKRTGYLISKKYLMGCGDVLHAWFDFQIVHQTQIKTRKPVCCKKPEYLFGNEKRILRILNNWSQMQQNSFQILGVPFLEFTLEQYFQEEIVEINSAVKIYYPKQVNK